MYTCGYNDDGAIPVEVGGVNNIHSVHQHSHCLMNTNHHMKLYLNQLAHS